MSTRTICTHFTMHVLQKLAIQENRVAKPEAIYLTLAARLLMETRLIRMGTSVAASVCSSPSEAVWLVRSNPAPSQLETTRLEIRTTHLHHGRTELLCMSGNTPIVVASGPTTRSLLLLLATHVHASCNGWAGICNTGQACARAICLDWCITV